ncbi:MAG TPA: PhoH family protein [Kiloniellales bacterium]|nr:PhoH family protein [Kiloniellales bacterium]
MSEPLQLQFDDNSLLPLLFGQHDENLVRLEQQLGVSLASFGNRVTVTGPEGSQQAAGEALGALYERLKQGMTVGNAEVDAAARLALSQMGGGAGPQAMHGKELALITKKRHVTPRSPGQVAYLNALFNNELVFGLGPAGTGKTYLAVAMAVTWLVSGRVDRLILSRPAVEAGERLGFLPGDMKEKVDPYLRPLYDALHDLLPGDQVNRRLETGEIEIAPLAFMRGRTLSNAFIILDEAQNTTPTQMKMFLTRLGENSRMVITGDLSQVDLPRGQRSGLRDAADLLAGIESVDFVQFTDADVVRHKLVTRIVQAYAARDASLAQEADLFERQ